METPDYQPDRDLVHSCDQSAEIPGISSSGAPVVPSEVDTEEENYAEESVSILSYEELWKRADKGWKKAKSKALTREINLYAALRDLYKTIPKIRRMQASQQVAVMRERGPSYARTMCAHARYFESHLELRKSKRDLLVKMCGLLGDETVQNEVKIWLRTLKPGMVSQAEPR